MTVGKEDDDGCPHGDPDCLGNNGDCHDACSTFASRAREQAAATARPAYRRHPLNEFGDRWGLNGDLIWCRGCEREQHVLHALAAFQHRSGCRHEDAERNPWKSLASLIGAQIAKAKEPDHAE